MSAASHSMRLQTPTNISGTKLGVDIVWADFQASGNVPQRVLDAVVEDREDVLGGVLGPHVHDHLPDTKVIPKERQRLQGRDAAQRAHKADRSLLCEVVVCASEQVKVGGKDTCAKPPSSRSSSAFADFTNSATLLTDSSSIPLSGKKKKRVSPVGRR